MRPVWICTQRIEAGGLLPLLGKPFIEAYSEAAGIVIMTPLLPLLGKPFIEASPRPPGSPDGA